MNIDINTTHYDICPKCGLDFNGKDIFEVMLDQCQNNTLTLLSHEEINKRVNEYTGLYPNFPDISEMDKCKANAIYRASSYGWTPEKPKCFRKEIGVQVDGFDGVMFWKCPKCKFKWKRFKDTPDHYIEDDL